MLFLRIGYTLIKTALNLAGIFYLVTPLSPEGHEEWKPTNSTITTRELAGRIGNREILDGLNAPALQMRI